MTFDDLDDMAELLGDPDVMTYYSHPRSRDEARAWIDWNLALYRDHGFGLWIMTLKETGAFVGDCGLTIQDVEGVDEVEVGYHVRTIFQGNGYASEAAAASRDHARDVVACSRLVALIDPNNVPSQRVAEHIGLTFEREIARKERLTRVYSMSLV